MATIYMRHPRHGTKVACTEQEAVSDEGRGWERHDVNAPADPPAPELPSFLAPASEPVNKLKPGPKPKPKE